MQAITPEVFFLFGGSEVKPKKKVKQIEIGKNLLSELKECQKKARVRGTSIVRQGR